MCTDNLGILGTATASIPIEIKTYSVDVALLGVLPGLIIPTLTRLCKSGKAPPRDEPAYSICVRFRRVDLALTSGGGRMSAVLSMVI